MWVKTCLLQLRLATIENNVSNCQESQNAPTEKHFPHVSLTHVNSADSFGCPGTDGVPRMLVGFLFARTAGHRRLLVIVAEGITVRGLTDSAARTSRWCPKVRGPHQSSTVRQKCSVNGFTAAVRYDCLWRFAPVGAVPFFFVCTRHKISGTIIQLILCPSPKRNGRLIQRMRPVRQHFSTFVAASTNARSVRTLSLYARCLFAGSCRPPV